MDVGGSAFREVTLVDFEYRCPDGELPEPICMVARELGSGRLHRVWADELGRLRRPPFPCGPDALVCAYYASAEIGCFLQLGWTPPDNLLDLFVEFRCRTNGQKPLCGAGLLGALVHFGEGAIAAQDKEAMRELALRGGPWTPDEQRALLDYCQSDVDALKRLLPRMDDGVDTPRALLRGRYMTAAARIERTGIPVDVDTLERLRANWEGLKLDLVGRVDRDYGVFDGTSFKADQWERWLHQQDIPWPRLPTGRLALDQDTFRFMARANPLVAPVQELRHALSQLRLADLAVGRDGRNRTLLSAFRARTGRNQPSNSKFLFGPSVWLRGLIQPPPGHGLAYIDWSQQEFGIAAALSGDPAMVAAYGSGDPYLAFAIQAGAAPPNATKQTHADVREVFKQCILGVQYAMGPEALAQRIGRQTAHARDLLRQHRQTYGRFWRWSDAVVDHAMLYGSLSTVFGWPVRVTPNSNPRSLRNFPMQANGAEMLRLACVLMTEAGIQVCAPVHDAVLIEAPLDELDATIARAQYCMARASKVVLDGMELRSDALRIRHPGRYMDPRGTRMWHEVMDLLANKENQVA